MHLCNTSFGQRAGFGRAGAYIAFFSHRSSEERLAHIIFGTIRDMVEVSRAAISFAANTRSLASQILER